MPRLLTAPSTTLFLSPQTKTPSQVGALIRASGYPSESPGKVRGIAREEGIGGKRQELGKEERRGRDWFEEGGRGG